MDELLYNTAGYGRGTFPLDGYQTKKPIITRGCSITDDRLSVDRRSSASIGGK
jgi:hypothetical protein